MNARVPFTAGTFNLGNATVNQIAKVVRECDVIGLQEASDRRDDLLHVASTTGYRAMTFADLPGGPATPLLFNPRVLLPVRPLFVPLLRGGTFVGPGTGPDHAKAKNLQGCYFVHKTTRRRVAVGNLHGLAGQKDENFRRQFTRGMLRDAVHEFDGYGGVPILLGDCNTRPDTDTTVSLRRRHWECNHFAADHPVATHGKHWNPDQVWWRKRSPRSGDWDNRLKFRAHHTIKTRSDHDALVVEFGLKERGAR